jgi:altronate dehydratase
MPRKKKGKPLAVHKPSPPLKIATNKESLNNMKNWLETVKGAKDDFQFDNELFEIISDEESDEFDCNLKELEVRELVGEAYTVCLKKLFSSFFQKPLNTLL